MSNSVVNAETFRSDMIIPQPGKTDWHLAWVIECEENPVHCAGGPGTLVVMLELVAPTTAVFASYTDALREFFVEKQDSVDAAVPFQAPWGSVRDFAWFVAQERPCRRMMLTAGNKSVAVLVGTRSLSAGDERRRPRAGACSVG